MTAGAAPLLEVIDLHVSYGKVEAVHGVTTARSKRCMA